MARRSDPTHPTRGTLGGFVHEASAAGLFGLVTAWGFAELALLVAGI